MNIYFYILTDDPREYKEWLKASGVPKENVIWIMKDEYIRGIPDDDPLRIFIALPGASRLKLSMDTRTRYPWTPRRNVG